MRTLTVMSVSSPARPVSRGLPSAPVLRGALLAFGAMSLLIGVFQVVDPAGFVHDIGPYGTTNEHYVRDLSTWSLSFGAVLLLGAGRPAWHVPLLALAVLQGALHLVNHVADIDAADPASMGIVNAVALAIVLGVLVWLLLGALRAAEARA